MHRLEIKNLHANIEGKEILKGINLTIKSGEVHVIMGPNGVGKSTLSHVIMGSSNYEITEGCILLDGVDITHMPTDERARRGLFLSFQNPPEIEGVTTADFLKASVATKEGESFKMLSFAREVDTYMKKLDMKKEFLSRSFNEGFSGGEKKKMEILSLYMLKPKIAILDEIDSGLDVDSLKIVGEHIQTYQMEKKAGLLLITHYQRLLSYIRPDFVHIFLDGRIKKTGDATLVEQIEKDGYDNFRKA
jgi:Fe-S cluster assembly ATP-binding protein